MTDPIDTDGRCNKRCEKTRSTAVFAKEVWTRRLARVQRISIPKVRTATGKNHLITHHFLWLLVTHHAWQLETYYQSAKANFPPVSVNSQHPDNAAPQQLLRGCSWAVEIPYHLVYQSCLQAATQGFRLVTTGPFDLDGCWPLLTAGYVGTTPWGRALAGLHLALVL